jgi:hypothetical protein
VGAEDGAEMPAPAFADWVCLCTSSLRTRPSLPVPSMSSILKFAALTMWRTAGVAREACLPGGFRGRDSGCTGSAGKDGADCAGVSPVAAAVSFLATSITCAFGSGLFGASSVLVSAPPSRTTASASDISLWMSMSTRGFPN